MLRHECQKRKRPAAYTRVPLQPSQVYGPFEKLGLDICGAYECDAHGMIYMLTIVDYCTKWSICIPLRNQKATRVAEVLMNYVFADYALPRVMITDQGSNFMSSVMDTLMKFLGREKTTSLP